LGQAQKCEGVKYLQDVYSTSYIFPELFLVHLKIQSICRSFLTHMTHIWNGLVGNPLSSLFKCCYYEIQNKYYYYNLMFPNKFE